MLSPHSGLVSPLSVKILSLIRLYCRGSNLIEVRVKGGLRVRIRIMFPPIICLLCGGGYLLRYCRNVRPTWVKFDSKDTKESGSVF